MGILRSFDGGWSISWRRDGRWRRQERIDRGVDAGLSTVEKAELAAAKRRIRELEAELAVHRRASELLKETNHPKVDSQPSA